MHLDSPQLRLDKTHPPPLTDALKAASENCARIKDLGFTISKHITMYGEHFELVSDPFIEGDYTAVHAITQNDPGIRTLRLPVAILIGLAERFRKPARLAIRARDSVAWPYSQCSGPTGPLTPNQSEQFRPAIASRLSDHSARDEHPGLSFRSSELSQPI